MAYVRGTLHKNHKSVLTFKVLTLWGGSQACSLVWFVFFFTTSGFKRQCSFIYCAQLFPVCFHVLVTAQSMCYAPIPAFMGRNMSPFLASEKAG